MSARGLRIQSMRVKRVLEMQARQDKVSQIEDDGYSVSNKFIPVWSSMKRQFQKVFRSKPGTLILVRHGESELNNNKTFTGWIDVDLSDRGQREVEHAARLLVERGYSIDVAFTSRLKR